jgi:hypothetical protein
MADALTWIAVKGTPQERLRTVLGLKPTGRSSPGFDWEFGGASLANDWQLIVHGFENETGGFSEAELRDLSAHGSLVLCVVDEYSLCSRTSGWTRGREAWGVTHDGTDPSGVHLAVTGELPPAYETIRARIYEEKNDADRAAEQGADGGHGLEVDLIFEIPSDLARELTGFRHDDPETERPPLEVLTRG